MHIKESYWVSLTIILLDNLVCTEYNTNLTISVSGAAEANPFPQERDNMFLVHMAMVMDGAVKKWQCILCGKMAKLKGDILDVLVFLFHLSPQIMYTIKLQWYEGWKFMYYLDLGWLSLFQ